MRAGQLVSKWRMAIPGWEQPERMWGDGLEGERRRSGRSDRGLKNAAIKVEALPETPEAIF